MLFQFSPLKIFLGLRNKILSGEIFKKFEKIFSPLKVQSPYIGDQILSGGRFSPLNRSTAQPLKIQLPILFSTFLELFLNQNGRYQGGLFFTFCLNNVSDFTPDMVYLHTANFFCCSLNVHFRNILIGFKIPSPKQIFKQSDLHLELLSSGIQR